MYKRPKKEKLVKQKLNNKREAMKQNSGAYSMVSVTSDPPLVWEKTILWTFKKSNEYFKTVKVLHIPLIFRKQPHENTVARMMAKAKRIWILMIKVNKLFPFSVAVFSKRNGKHVTSLKKNYLSTRYIFYENLFPTKTFERISVLI